MRHSQSDKSLIKQKYWYFHLEYFSINLMYKSKSNKNNVKVSRTSLVRKRLHTCETEILVKFSFSEKATKICAIFLMVLKFTK